MMPDLAGLNASEGTGNRPAFMAVFKFPENPHVESDHLSEGYSNSLRSYSRLA